MEVANIVVVYFKKCSLVKKVLHVGQFTTIGAHAFFLGLLEPKTTLGEDHHSKNK